jgi:hypothetical protein
MLLDHTVFAGFIVLGLMGAAFQTFTSTFSMVLIEDCRHALSATRPVEQVSRA